MPVLPGTTGDGIPEGASSPVHQQQQSSWSDAGEPLSSLPTGRSAMATTESAMHRALHGTRLVGEQARMARTAPPSSITAGTAAAPPRLPPQRLVPPPPTARRPPGSGQGLPRAMRTATACVASVCGGWQASVERRRRAGAPRPYAVIPLGNVRTLIPIGDSISSPIGRRARSERGRKNFRGVSKQRCEADPSLPHAHRG